MLNLAKVFINCNNTVKKHNYSVFSAKTPSGSDKYGEVHFIETTS